MPLNDGLTTTRGPRSKASLTDARKLLGASSPIGAGAAASLERPRPAGIQVWETQQGGEWESPPSCLSAPGSCNTIHTAPEFIPYSSLDPSYLRHTCFPRVCANLPQQYNVLRESGSQIQLSRLQVPLPTYVTLGESPQAFLSFSVFPSVKRRSQKYLLLKIVVKLK